MKRDIPTIGFSGVFSIIVTLATLVFLEQTTDPYMKWGKAFFFIIVYFILALSQVSVLDKIAEVMTLILNINKDDDLSGAEEKILIIRNQLDLFSDKFSSIFTEVRQFHHELGKKKGSKKKWRGTTEIIKTSIKSVINGNITPVEGAWVIMYASYQILIATNYWVIALPYNMIITIVFIAILELTVPNLGGIGTMLKDIYSFAHKEIAKAEKTTKSAEKIETEYKFILANIVHTIRLLCLSFNRIANSISRHTGQTVMEFLLCGQSKCPYLANQGNETVKAKS